MEDVFYNILIVEDNPGDFMIVEELLEEQSVKHNLIRASTFKEAELIINSNGKNFDVILLDLSLPDKSGENLITSFFELPVNCPVIVLTGYGDINFSIKSISHGVSDYLLKDELSSIALFKSIIYAIERTNYIKTIETKNSALKEIAWMQSHKVRAPLVRVMSLINFIQDGDFTEMELDEILKQINNSCNELDGIIKQIVNKSETVG